MNRLVPDPLSLATASRAAALILIGALCAVQADSQKAERFELASIKATRPALARTAAALRNGDIATAKAAFADFETGWRGIEVYISARDRKTFAQENEFRVKILNGLSQPKPEAARLAGDAQMLLAKHDAMIASVTTAPPLDPLFDDVARLRIFRAALREVDIALRAGDFAQARSKLGAVVGARESVKGILKARLPEALDAVDNGIAELQNELKTPKPDASKSMSFIAGITAKYNVVLNQVTLEARNRQLSTSK